MAPQSAERIPRRSALKAFALGGAVLVLGPEACAQSDPDRFVYDALMKPLDIGLSIPPENFKEEYDRVWGQNYLDQPGDPGDKKAVDLVFETVGKAESSNYKLFMSVGRWLGPRLTRDREEARRKTGVYLRSVEPFSFPAFDTTHFSTGPLITSDPRKIGGELQVHRQWMTRPLRDADLKYIRLIGDLAHEYQHLQDDSRILMMGAANGYDRSHLRNLLDNKYLYLLEARGYFISSAIFVLMTPYEKSFAPTQDEEISGGYSQLYDTARDILQKGGGWQEPRWISLIKRLLDQKMIEISALASK